MIRLQATGLWGTCGSTLHSQGLDSGAGSQVCSTRLDVHSEGSGAGTCCCMPVRWAGLWQRCAPCARVLAAGLVLVRRQCHKLGSSLVTVCSSQPGCLLQLATAWRLRCCLLVFAAGAQQTGTSALYCPHGGGVLSLLAAPRQRAPPLCTADLMEISLPARVWLRGLRGAAAHQHTGSNAGHGIAELGRR